jgi:hypothetical protein
MTRPLGLTRRQLLVGAGGLVVLTAGGGLGLAACGGTDDEHAAADQARPDVSGLDAIGVAYVDATPDEASRDAIEAALGLAVASAGGTAIDPLDLLAQRATSIRGDFHTDDVVELDGWVLSRTEARIAALAAFESGAL